MVNTATILTSDWSRVRHLEAELAAAVDKIYELRDIIRGLETQLDTRSQLEAAEQSQLVTQLRRGLEEAVLSQQLVSQELEQLRMRAGADQELVAHIQLLEDQLSSKSAELSRHRYKYFFRMDVIFFL